MFKRSRFRFALLIVLTLFTLVMVAEEMTNIVTTEWPKPEDFASYAIPGIRKPVGVEELVLSSDLGISTIVWQGTREQFYYIVGQLRVMQGVEFYEEVMTETVATMVFISPNGTIIAVVYEADEGAVAIAFHEV